ncbi:MAG: hypothetical protein V4692_12075 [Bdellovibrionota bacterium]
MKIALVLPVLFLGCTHTAKLPATLPAPAASRTTLIPEGTHNHSVKLTVKNTLSSGQNQGPKQMSFSGIVDYRSGKVKVIGLSPLGSTLFRLEDDLKTEITTFQTDISEMKKAEPFIRDYYAPVRQLLKLPYPPKLTKIDVDSTGFEFKEYDSFEVPRRIAIETEKFKLDIEVDSYEP